MAIDNGITLVDSLLKRGLIKTTTHGYVLTKLGVEELFNGNKKVGTENVVIKPLFAIPEQSEPMRPEVEGS